MEETKMSNLNKLARMTILSCLSSYVSKDAKSLHTYVLNGYNMLSYPKTLLYSAVVATANTLSMTTDEHEIYDSFINIINKLEDDNIIYYQPDDKREQCVYLTHKGFELVKSEFHELNKLD